MDVTTLKITVDAGGVEKARTALDQLSNAAKRAQAALSGVSASMKSAGALARSAASAANKAATALHAQGAAAAKAAVAMRSYSAAARSSASAAKVENVGNVASRLQGVADPAESPMQKLGAAVLSAVSPTKYLTMGVDALVAAGSGMVDWSNLASAALIGVADVLEDIAPYAVGAAVALALMHAPAIVGGIGTVIVLLGDLSAAALRAGASLTAAWLRAMGPVGWLIGGIAAIVAAATMFRDELTRILGEDIVQAAITGANYVIGSFMAAYYDLEFIWKNFPDIMEAAAIGAVNAVIRAVNDMIGSVKEGVNTTIGYLNKIPGFDIALLEPGSGSIKELSNPAAARLATANADHQKRSEEAFNGKYIENLNAGVGNLASGAKDKIQGMAAGLSKQPEGPVTNIDVGGKPQGKGYADITAGADKKIAALLAERDMLGMTEEAAAALRYEQELLNQAQEEGIALAPKEEAGLKLRAKRMAGLEAATKKAKEAIEFAKEVTKGFVSDLRKGLADGEGFWKSFSNASLNALDRIVDKLLNNVLDTLFQVDQPGASGRGFLGWVQTIFGSLLGGGGGPPDLSPAAAGVVSSGGMTGRFAKGGAFAGGVQMFADGAAFTNSIVSRPTLFPFARGIGLMGEAGPEAIMPLRRDGQGRLGVAATGANNNQPPAMNLNFAPTINMPNAQPGAGQEVKAVLKQYEREFTGNVLRSLREIKQKGLA